MVRRGHFEKSIREIPVEKVLRVWRAKETSGS